MLVGLSNLLNRDDRVGGRRKLVLVYIIHKVSYGKMNFPQFVQFNNLLYTIPLSILYIVFWVFMLFIV